MRIAVALALLLAACTDSRELPRGLFPQEPLAETRFVSGDPRGWAPGNTVAFGVSVAPEHRDQITAEVARVVAGRLPGVAFEVYSYPLATHNGPHSFRAPTLRLVVLSWWTGPGGRWAFGDLSWEVEHLVAGTDDSGRPWRP